jgi:hypothetical protein
MASAKATTELTVSAEEVWQLIGGFESLTDWLPGIADTKVTEGGRVRHLTTPDGQLIVEELEIYDLAQRTYSYSILESPFPITAYRATITVSAAATGCHVEWGATFTPIAGSEEKAQKLFDRLFSHGLEALKAHYVGK